MEFFEVVKKRRSEYALDDKISLSEEQIIKIVETSLKDAPTAFNSQGSRVLILLNKEHHKLWNITLDILKKIIPEERVEETTNRLKRFDQAYGTILFFEDQEVIKKYQSQYQTYKDNFPLWSYQSSGMLQYIIWSSFTASGLGASLQHYNPLIDEQVKEIWSIPENWTLIAEMPFGHPIEEPDPKDYLPLTERIKIAK